MTVTVWGVFQLAAVNVTMAGDTVPSVVSLDVRPIVTSASAGSSARREGGRAAGLRCDQAAGWTDCDPAVSLSVLVTAHRRRSGRCNSDPCWSPPR